MSPIKATAPRRLLPGKTLAVVAFVTFIAVSTFAADTKEDFRDAARGSGCKLIPYGELGRACFEAYDKQRDWCSGDKKVGCSNLDKDKPDDRELAKERMENASQCIEKRGEVKKIYEEALERLEKESDNPDPDIKQIASELIERIKAEQQGHTQATEETENRRRKCDDLANDR